MNKQRIKEEFKEKLKDGNTIKSVFAYQKMLIMLFKGKIKEEIESDKSLKSKLKGKTETESVEIAIRNIDRMAAQWQELITTDDYNQAVKNLLDDRTESIKNNFFTDLLGGTSVIYTEVVSSLINVLTEKEALEIQKEVTYITMLQPHFNENTEISEEIKEILTVCNKIEQKIARKINERLYEETTPKYTQQKLNLEFNDVIPMGLNKLTLNNGLYTENSYEVMELLPKEILNQKFEIDNGVLEESEAVLKNKLTKLDILVLDAITLEIYMQQGLRQFTDRQIVGMLTKENSSATVGQVPLKKINEIIEKLQKTNISLAIKTKTEDENLKAKITQENPLIWLKKTKIEHKSGITHYEIIGEPFYCTYVNKVGAIEESKRYLLYTEDTKKGYKNDLETAALKRYIEERIVCLKRISKVEIKNTQVYAIFNVDSAHYNNTNSLRKAQQRARDKMYMILKEYREAYKDEINFSIHVNKKGNQSKGYYLIKRNIG